MDKTIEQQARELLAAEVGCDVADLESEFIQRDDALRAIARALTRPAPTEASMKVYVAEWCPCVYESAYGVMSIHETRDGAESALQEKLKQKEAKEKDMRNHGYHDYEEHSAGRIVEIEVLSP